MAVKRVWHGWENADTYQNLLHNEIFPGIEAKKIPGYKSIELLRRDLDDEVESHTFYIRDRKLFVHYYTKSELLSFFSNWKLIYYSETQMLRTGKDCPEIPYKASIELLVQKPF